MKYMVITGASSGIGYETALAFAKRGKNLVLAARREDKLEELKDKIKEVNPKVEVIIHPVDLSLAENAHTLYESLKKYDLETWINNAGFGNLATIGEQNLSKIEKMLRLNIESLTILSTLFVRDYEHVEGTQLINVSSIGGYTIYPETVTYSATKFYVSAFTEGLSRELREKGAKMQAKVLAPASTESEFAQRALDMDNFQYEESMPKFHTSKEMATFMLELYDNQKTVGIVDPSTYEFQLKDIILPYAEGESVSDSYKN